MTITDDYGDTWRVTSVRCAACQHVVTGKALEPLAEDERCPRCGDGGMVYDGERVSA